MIRWLQAWNGFHSASGWTETRKPMIRWLQAWNGFHSNNNDNNDYDTSNTSYKDTISYHHINIHMCI